jgi:nitronate monooxygenase
MARVVTPELVAEVGRAGGLGILAGAGVPPAELRGLIRRVRELGDRPFGVNLILHPAACAPLQPDQIPEATLVGVQAALNRIRGRLGLPAAPTVAPALPAIVDEAFEVIAEERVPLFSTALGKPTPAMVSRCRAQGTRVVSMAATVADAVEVAAIGVDAIVAQGGEAGGHRSTWIKRESKERAAVSTLALVPQVVDAVRVPVVAAGGIVDGRQLAAALALGASGVLMGTRFVATRESAAPDFYKQALVERDSDATTITDAFTGLYARALRNAFTEEYQASGAPVIPVVQQALMADIASASAQRESGNFYPMYAGQGLGMIRDVPAAASVVQNVIAEAERTLAELSARAGSR